MVLLVQAARNPCPPVVVSCTTVSPVHALLVSGPLIPADILHGMVLVAAAVVTGHTLRSQAVVKVLPEEVESLNNPVACLEVSKCPSRERLTWRTDSRWVEDIPVVVMVRNLVEEEGRSLEVGEVHNLEAGIVAVVDSHVVAPGRGSRT